MGTPEFAVGSLQRLVENGYNVVAVVTQPDKPVGRHGSVLRPSPVKEYALAHNLPVLQPVKMKDEQFLEWAGARVSESVRKMLSISAHRISTF